MGVDSLNWEEEEDDDDLAYIRPSLERRLRVLNRYDIDESEKEMRGKWLTGLSIAPSKKKAPIVTLARKIVKEMVMAELPVTSRELLYLMSLGGKGGKDEFMDLAEYKKIVRMTEVFRGALKLALHELPIDGEASLFGIGHFSLDGRTYFYLKKRSAAVEEKIKKAKERADKEAEEKAREKAREAEEEARMRVKEKERAAKDEADRKVREKRREAEARDAEKAKRKEEKARKAEEKARKAEEKAREARERVEKEAEEKAEEKARKAEEKAREARERVEKEAEKKAREKAEKADKEAEEKARRKADKEAEEKARRQAETDRVGGELSEQIRLRILEKRMAILSGEGRPKEPTLEAQDATAAQPDQAAQEPTLEAQDATAALEGLEGEGEANVKKEFMVIVGRDLNLVGDERELWDRLVSAESHTLERPEFTNLKVIDTLVKKINEAIKNKFGDAFPLFIASAFTLLKTRYALIYTKRIRKIRDDGDGVIKPEEEAAFILETLKAYRVFFSEDKLSLLTPLLKAYPNSLTNIQLREGMTDAGTFDKILTSTQYLFETLELGVRLVKDQTLIDGKNIRGYRLTLNRRLLASKS